MATSVTATSYSPVSVVARIIEQEGGLPGYSLHSWRCEYPERYGACTCVVDLAELVVDALHLPGAG